MFATIDKKIVHATPRPLGTAQPTQSEGLSKISLGNLFEN